MAETSPYDAGREMDVAIAECAFGEVEVNAPCGDGLTRTAAFIVSRMADADDAVRCAYPRSIGAGMKIWPAEYIGPAYSTDVAAAFEALEQVGGIAKIARMSPNDWRVRVGDGMEWWAETLPLAICRALLNAAATPPSDGGR